MNTGPPMFPNDVDGDVLRALQAKGFDFASEHSVDFFVDFGEHPNRANVEESVRVHLPTAQCEWESEKCLVVSVVMRVTHHGVVDTQEVLSRAVADVGGWCDAWGVISS